MSQPSLSLSHMYPAVRSLQLLHHTTNPHRRQHLPLRAISVLSEFNQAHKHLHTKRMCFPRVSHAICMCVNRPKNASLNCSVNLPCKPAVHNCQHPVYLPQNPNSVHMHCHSTGHTYAPWCAEPHMPDRAKANSGLNHSQTQLQLQLLPLLLHRTLVVLSKPKIKMPQKPTHAQNPEKPALARAHDPIGGVRVLLLPTKTLEKVCHTRHDVLSPNHRHFPVTLLLLLLLLRLRTATRAAAAAATLLCAPVGDPFPRLLHIGWDGGAIAATAAAGAGLGHGGCGGWLAAAAWGLGAALLCTPVGNPLLGLLHIGWHLWTKKHSHSTT